MNYQPKILVADDSPAIRSKLTEIFSDRGFQVIEATDGLDCIIKVFKHFPHFVILDVKMPKITGYQACRFIKNHPETSGIPVMLLTALDKPIDELWGYETGADLYRSKSGNLNKLVDEVIKFIQKNEPTLSSKEIDITESDILSFLNEILDNRLFELTLINDITNLSFKTNDINELITSCAQYLHKITNFYSIGFALEHEEQIKVYLYSPFEYGEPVDDLVTFSRDTFRKRGLYNVDFIYNVGLEAIPAAYNEQRELVFIDNFFEKQPTESGHVISGGIFISVDKEDLKQINRINFLLNTILLVIHNGMLYQKVLDLSMIDELTSLFNRRKIMEILNTEIERSKRYGFDMSVIMADIDDFKHINDNYGHKTGDTVLKKISAILKNSVRKVDYVGRFGGEEFLIVSPQTTLENGIILAERIRRVIETVSIEGLPRKVTISFGLSSLNKDKSLDKLISDADEALYDAKKAGKNCVKWRV